MKIDGNQLTIQEVVDVANQQENVQLAEPAYEKMRASEAWVQGIVEAGEPVYGINTGFGIFSSKKISAEDTAALNRNLILSHAVGTGPDLAEDVVCAAMLIRANTLSSGYSGISIPIVENLLTMLEKGVIPCIPSQGSLGSSGDLAPLSHLALVLTCGENNSEENSGWAMYQGERMSGKAAMQAAGIERLKLGPKGALAITNGATFSAAIAALVVQNTEILLNTAELSLSMSLEGLLGTSKAFDERIHAVRRQIGQQAVAARVRELTAGSTLMNAAGRVQDAYSLRCAPQVMGPARDTLDFVKGIIEREINAVTDNPLLFGPGEAISGGNFHGEPIAMAMDFLKIALSEVAAIAERRVFQLTDGKMNSGLPAMLVASEEHAGLNSGLMMPQYTAVSLVLENQHLANPDSTHSLPTSGGQEDHNANSMTAARHAYQVMVNTAHVLAIEIYTAARALDLRMQAMPDNQMGAGVAEGHRRVREKVPFQAEDAWWAPEIEAVREMVLGGELDL